MALHRGSDNMPLSSEGQVLVRSRKLPIAIFTLLALLVAQAAAGLHAARHFRAGGDAPGLPGTHAQLCLECTTFAPLAFAHGGAVASFTVASLGLAEFIRPNDDAAGGFRHRAAYRSRAPPR
jgi:hypothetical protein